MDRLYQRYADPFSFMDGMIRTGRFVEFVESFWQTTHKEKEEDTTWQFFLHKVFEGSYSDFKEGIKNDRENQNMSARTIETTINHSLDILNNFNPEKGGEE